MEYLRVRNWEKYQHYGTHRKPPWIKLYWSFVCSPDVHSLSDTCKYHVIAIMLLASQHDNKIPFNKSWIASVIHAESRIKWDAILNSGIIECYQDASNTLAIVPPRVDEEEYKEEKTPKSPKGTLCETGKTCNGKFDECHKAFDLIWNEYPRHVPGKTECLKAWCKQFHQNQSVDIIVAYIRRAKPGWTDIKFVPHLTKFLNQRYWEGDLPAGAESENQYPVFKLE